MFEQFLFYLAVATVLLFGVICGFFVVAYRWRQARRSAPPMLWGFNDSDDSLSTPTGGASAGRRLIATIGYADRAKLVTRN